MAELDMTSADAALKQIYKPKNFVFSTYTRRPIIGSMPKDETFFGRNMPLVNNYNNPQGVSATFSVAQANASAAGLEDYLLTRVNEHSVALIDGETLDAMSNSSGAFVTSMKVQVDGAMKALADRLESMAPGSGNGELARTGVIGNDEGTNDRITLANINDVFKFEVNMYTVWSDGTAAAGGALRDSGESEKITKIDRRNGYIGYGSAINLTTQISGLTASTTTGDWIYPEGDAKNGGSTFLVTAGLSAWLPSTPPSSGALFFNVDRAVDTRLYGHYSDESGQLVTTALINGQSIIASEGGAPDTVFMHHVKCRQLAKELEAKSYNYRDYSQARYKGGKPIGGISYSAFLVYGDHGPMKVMAANKMASDTAFILEIMTWLYGSIGPLTKFNTAGRFSKGILSQASDDGVEARLVSRANLGCLNANANGRVLLS